MNETKFHLKSIPWKYCLKTDISEGPLSLYEVVEVIWNFCFISGENKCGTEQPGSSDLLNEDGEINHGQSDSLSGKICKTKICVL